MGAADGDPAGEPVVARVGARFPSAHQLGRYAEDEAPAEPGPVSGKSRPAGARFPTEKQMEKYDEPPPESEPPPEPTPAPAPGPPPSRRPSPHPRPVSEPPVDDLPWPQEPEPSDLPSAPPPDYGREIEPEQGDDGPRVRPYVLTRGRTQSSYELALETLVNVRADANWSGAALGAEYQPVRVLCQQVVSVAEVAAGLNVPLGVARVLLSDMAELGLLHIHGTERTSEGRPPVALMRRVLAGLQKL